MPYRLIAVVMLLSAFIGFAVANEEKSGYLLGPQDEISVTVQRHPELSHSYTVPPDGVIDVPRAGRITVTKVTVSEVAEAIRGKYAEFLVNPEVTVAITKARQRSAFVLGAVTKPGQYPLLAETRVTELLAAAGDLVGDSGELSAHLKRGTETIPLNLAELLSGKNAEGNLPVQEGDLLWVMAPARITVTVLGQVKTPGPVKLREGSTPVDALAAAGDITDRPDRIRINLVRGKDTAKLTWGDASKTLIDGDVIQVEKEILARVYINGHVQQPGAYELPAGGGVMEAIALAGGTLPAPALAQVTIIRAADGSTERVDLTNAFGKGEVTTNPKLAPGDQVIVPESTAHVSVWGMVTKTGNYPFNNSAPMTVVDALSLAGGADKRAKLSKVTVIRVINGKPQRIEVNVDNILKKGKQEQNLQLQANDIVYVPETGNLDWGKILDGLSKIGVLATVL